MNRTSAVAAGLVLLAVTTSAAAAGRPTSHTSHGPTTLAAAVSVERRPSPPAGGVSVTVPVASFGPSDGLPSHVAVHARAHLMVLIAGGEDGSTVSVTADGVVLNCLLGVLPAGIVTRAVCDVPAGLRNLRLVAHTPGGDVVRTYRHT